MWFGVEVEDVRYVVSESYFLWHSAIQTSLLQYKGRENLEIG